MAFVYELNLLGLEFNAQIEQVARAGDESQLAQAAAAIDAGQLLLQRKLSKIV